MAAAQRNRIRQQHPPAAIRSTDWLARPSLAAWRFMLPTISSADKRANARAYGSPNQADEKPLQ